MAEKVYIEYRIFLLGESQVGKHSIINKINNLPCTQTIKEKKIYKKKKKSKSKENREEIYIIDSDNKFNRNLNNNSDENNTKKKASIIKLYNILKYKITLCPFYIKYADKYPLNYTPINDEDSDYEVELKYKLSFKNLKKNVKVNLFSEELKLEENFLKDYQILIKNLFIFVFDLSDFQTFENLIPYYITLNKKYSFQNEENNISCILIGNKSDKKIILTLEQQKLLDLFITEKKIPYYEISTRIYFSFNKFFENILLENLSQIDSSFSSNNFVENFKQIFENKSSFNKAERNFNEIKNDVPGPKYNINIYGFDSENERKNSLGNKKLRFKTKIFVNKQGPIFNRNKSEVNILKSISDNDKFKPHFSKDMKDCYNKINKGFSFSGSNGQLNFTIDRKEMRKKRNKEFKSSFDSNNISDLMNEFEKNFKNEKYFENVQKRKLEYQEKIINEKKKKLEKIVKIHQDNLERIKNEKILSRNNILENKKIMKSKSSPDIFEENDKKNEKEKKERYYNILYLNNKKHIKNLEKIEKKESYSPGPNSYDIRGDLLNINKGKTILGKRSNSIIGKLDIPFSTFKSSFEQILEKKSNLKRTYQERFPKIIIEPKINKNYIDEEIWKKWEKNKLMENNEKLKLFLDDRKDYYNRQKELYKQIKEEKEKRHKEIINYLNKKGHLIGNEINYNQIEEKSPSYSILGKHYIKERSDDDFEKDFNLDDNYENLFEKNKSLNPNYFIGKDNYPSYSFNKSQRFPKEKIEYYYNQKNSLFENGNFSLKDKEDFSKKEPYSYNDQRGNYFFNSNSPAPGQYKIKSQFDKLVEEGKEKNENKMKIMKKNHSYLNFS